MPAAVTLWVWLEFGTDVVEVVPPGPPEVAATPVKVV